MADTRRPNQQDVLRLVEIAKAGDEAKLKLAALIEPVVMAEAMNRRVPKITVDEMAAAFRIKLFAACFKWVPGGGMSLYSWLVRCAQNTTIDLARKQGRSPVTVDDEPAIEKKRAKTESRALDVEDAVRRRVKGIASGVCPAETLELLDKLRPNLPTMRKCEKWPSGQDAEILALELIEVYRDVAIAMAMYKGHRGKVCRYLGMHREALETIAKDFLPKGAKRFSWSA